MTPWPGKKAYTVARDIAKARSQATADFQKRIARGRAEQAKVTWRLAKARARAIARAANDNGSTHD